MHRNISTLIDANSSQEVIRRNAKEVLSFCKFEKGGPADALVSGMNNSSPLASHTTLRQCIDTDHTEVMHKLRYPCIHGFKTNRKSK